MNSPEVTAGTAFMKPSITEPTLQLNLLWIPRLTTEIYSRETGCLTNQKQNITFITYCCLIYQQSDQRYSLLQRLSHQPANQRTLNTQERQAELVTHFHCR